MSDTITPSLLQRVRGRDEAAWGRLMQLFTPLVYEWARRAGLSEHDAADVVQDVFAGVLRGIGDFSREREGATFRGWLRRITQFKVADFRRRGEAVAEGGTDANLRLQDQPDAADEDDPAAGELLVRRGLDLIRDEFEPRTWRAFQAVALEGRAAAEVATESGMSVGAVYVAKSRVMKRLREELDGLI
jgi:RNA polymerase sigma-70 factor (ECF subfamily)